MKKFFIVTTCPLSEKHVRNILHLSNNLEIQVYENIALAKTALAWADILITYGEDLTSEIIKECKKLKWIQVISAGLELIPFEQIIKQEILITNVKGIHKIPMAEYTLAMMLTFPRRLRELYSNQLDNSWDRAIRFEELCGKTISIIGAGAIGSEIAHKCKAFDMKVIGIATNVRKNDYFDDIYDVNKLDSVLQNSDYIVLTLPLTAKTEGLIGKSQLALMKQTAIIINIARGKIIDETALITALKQQQIGGAVLDVFTEEPLPEGHPFWTLKNCLVTPHISSRSPKYMERAQEIFIHNLDVYLNGNGIMHNIIDPLKGY